MTTLRLEALLNSSKSIIGVSNKEDNVQLQRDLAQIASESHLLSTRLGVNQGLQATAHYFLAQGGANTEHISQNIEKIDTKDTFQPTLRIPSHDIDSYIDQLQKDLAISTVREARHNTKDQFTRRADNMLSSQWKNAKQKLYEEWAEEDSNISGRKIPSSTEQQALRKKLFGYSSVIGELNQCRLLSKKMPIIKKLQQLSVDTTSNQKVYMSDSWDIVSCMANESRESGSQIQSLYRNNNFDQSHVVEMNNALINSAKCWLENEFLTYVNKHVNENAMEARVGGTPSVERRIRAYMGLVYKRNAEWADASLVIEGDVPIWLYTYLFIRSGHPELALKFVDQERQSFRRTPKFCSYLKEYLSSPTRMVSDAASAEILQEYQNMKYGVEPVDAYKVTLYRMIGRCELKENDIPGVLQTTEDYLWYQLVIIREQVLPESYEYQRYRLTDLQDKIQGAGPSHFNPHGSNPFLYFKVLLLSLQFEQAIEYLHSFEQFRIDAVHFGIALAYYALVRVPTDSTENSYDLLTTDRDGLKRLNLGLLITTFVRLYVHDDPECALQYLLLITLYPTSDMITLCRKKIVKYIVESYHHQKTMALIDPKNVQHTGGSITAFQSLFNVNDEQMYMETILYPVAKELSQKGNYVDSVKVFEMSRSYMEALKVLTRALDMNLNKQDDTNHIDQDKIRLVTFCTETMRRYEEFVAFDYSEEVHSTFQILLAFLKATIEYKRKDYMNVIEIINSVNVFPKRNDSVQVGFYVQQLSKRSPVISKHIFQILDILLDCYYETLKTNPTYELLINERVAASMTLFYQLALQCTSDITKELNRKFALFPIKK